MTDFRPTEERFWEFHRANPRVFETLRRLSFEAKHKGHRRVGIDLLFARFRWEHPVETHGSDFKISNDFKPYYARLLMAEVPNLVGLFALKRLQVPEPEWSRHLLTDEQEEAEREALGGEQLALA